MDMNGLLSGLASAQGNTGGNKKCCNNNNNNGIGGFGGGNSIIWIIIILLIFCGGFGGQQDCGTVCGCEKKHCKELCRCGGGSNVGGFGGLGGFGGGCGSGFGIWWIIILIFLFSCGNNQNKGCTTNIINVDDCDE